MSKTAVAAALGVSRQTLYDILNEQQPVTAEMAVRFGKLFGNGAGFWANLQRSHDLAVAERTVDVFRDTKLWRFVDRWHQALAAAERCNYLSPRAAGTAECRRQGRGGHDTAFLPVGGRDHHDRRHRGRDGRGVGACLRGKQQPVSHEKRIPRSGGSGRAVSCRNLLLRACVDPVTDESDRTKQLLGTGARYGG